MFALRRVYTIQNNQLVIQLPSSFESYRTVEVIVLPVKSSQKEQLSTQEFLHRFAGVIPNFPEIESPGILQEPEELS
jgi:hypothetical protein